MKNSVYLQYISLLIVVGCLVLCMSFVSAAPPAVHEGFAPDVQPSWVPPIGIPRPDFGIEETVDMYAGELYAFTDGRGTVAYPISTVSGKPYTHYVDMNDMNAKDSGNPYGTEQTPRSTIPLILPAGSIVEVHGGPYTISAKYVVITAQGSVESPVFVRGVSENNMPVLSFYAQLSGSYLILEYLHFDNGRLALHGDLDQDFMSVRHSEFQNSIGPAIGINSARDTIIYNNNIHDNIAYSPQVDYYGYSGIELWGHGDTDRVWIVDNHVHHNGEDGFKTHIGMPMHIYIGRNEMNHNRGHAVNIRVAEHCIISQNKFYGYYVSDSAHGMAVRIDDEEVTSNTWVIFNDIYDSRFGIVTYGASPPPYIIGNKIYDFVKEDWRGHAVVTRGITGGAAGYVIHNTIHGADKGIAEDNAVIANNIISQASIYHIYGDVEISNNIMWQNGEPFTTWGLASPVNCLEVDPLFVDAQKGNFQLSVGSPAIDAGTVSEVYQMFFDLYGLDIAVDFDGGKRPYGAAWDIGAHEWGSTPVDSDPGPGPEPEPEL